MLKLSWWKRIVMVSVGCLAMVAALAGKPRQGRSAEAPEPVQAAEAKIFQYAGSKFCSNCHSATKENPGNNPAESFGFIKLNESITWDKEDKHSIAFKRLNSDRGRRMAGLLQIDVTKREAGCLNCHSASVAEMTNRANQGVQYDLSEGVSCENCHGPSSDWIFQHAQPAFRTKTPADWAKTGFTDLRTPDRQADKCLSCHIGSSEEGKVVTHEMYAAGHPPLPSIEVATFVDSIPRHWWLLAERKDPKMRETLGYQEGQLEQTKLAIVGAAVALKTSMKLLADEAKLAVKGPAPGQDWPDYARFDCWSCHHDLKRDSWRQARGYLGPPGRVPVSEWPKALVELGIDRLAMDDPAAAVLRSDLLRFEQALHESANVRPFGQKAAIAKAADDLAAWSSVLIQKLNAAPFDRAIAKKLLRKLVENAEKSSPDYDAARHIAWTIKLLVSELGEELPRAEAIKAVIAKFDKGLKLELPAGVKYEIEDQIGAALQTIGDYDPGQFRDNLKELAGLLPPL